MNIKDAREILDYKSPIDVRAIRYLFRLFCFHSYRDHVAESETLIGPILIKECEKCGHRKYKSMDGA